MQYRAHRYQTDFKVAIKTPFGRTHADVVNVSSTGARLAGPKELSRGDKISMDILSQPVSAVVLWAKSGQVGVSFRPPISNHQLDVLRKRVDGRTHRHPGRVGFNFPEMR